MGLIQELIHVLIQFLGQINNQFQEFLKILTTFKGDNLMGFLEMFPTKFTFLF